MRNESKEPCIHTTVVSGQHISNLTVWSTHHTEGCQICYHRLKKTNNSNIELHLNFFRFHNKMTSIFLDYISSIFNRYSVYISAIYSVFFWKIFLTFLKDIVSLNIFPKSSLYLEINLSFSFFLILLHCFYLIFLDAVLCKDFGTYTGLGWISKGDQDVGNFETVDNNTWQPHWC